MRHITAETGKKALRADGRWLVDALGRVVLLRGVNAGGDSKLPPFVPFPTEQSAEQIRSWGCNAVRYPTVWEAIEPEPDRFDEAYLDRMVEIVGWFTGRGIAVFIDMHQDLYARSLGGDGAPDWALPAPPPPLPSPLGEEWFFHYSSAPVVQAFTRFFTDRELQGHFIASLCRVAARFRDNPLVIGYDLLNEPWAGTFDLSSGQFEQEYLAPFYEQAIAAVRKVDPGALLFFEPPPTASGLLMMQSRLPPLRAQNLVYAPHFYPPGAIFGNEPDVSAAIEWIDRDLDLVQKKARELGTPALLGEFGVHPRQPDGERYVRGYYEMLDKHLLGGTIWTYAPRDLEWNHEGMSLVDGHLTERPFVAALVRPYPQAIAGEPLSLSYDAEQRHFRLEFRETGVSAPTLLHVPRRVYGSSEGLAITLSDGTWTFDEQGERIAWQHDPGVPVHSIRIAPKRAD